MARKMDFERYLEYKGDEIDNAAYGLAVALLRMHPDQTNEEILPWDMSIIAPIIEAAKEKLIRLGKEPCWPYYEEAKQCYRTGGCKNKQCYFSNDKEAKTQNEKNS